MGQITETSWIQYLWIKDNLIDSKASAAFTSKQIHTSCSLLLPSSLCFALIHSYRLWMSQSSSWIESGGAEWGGGGVGTKQTPVSEGCTWEGCCWASFICPLHSRISHHRQTHTAQLLWRPRPLFLYHANAPRSRPLRCYCISRRHLFVFFVSTFPPWHFHLTWSVFILVCIPLLLPFPFWNIVE